MPPIAPRTSTVTVNEAVEKRLLSAQCAQAFKMASGGCHTVDAAELVRTLEGLEQRLGMYDDDRDMASLRETIPNLIRDVKESKRRGRRRTPLLPALVRTISRASGEVRLGASDASEYDFADMPPPLSMQDRQQSSQRFAEMMTKGGFDDENDGWDDNDYLLGMIPL